MKKALIAVGGVGALVAIVAIPVLVALIAVVSFFVVTENTQSTDPCLDNPLLGTGPAYTGKRYLSGNQLASIVYSQAQGLGLGDLGAVAGIAAALSETNGSSAASLPDVGIKNGTIGDTISAGNAHLFRSPDGDGRPGDMTDSRGIFQQRQSWAPSGTAWSGLPFTYAQSRDVYSDRNPSDPSKKAPMNPWNITKWAISDPRMNPAQAANLFFLGGAGGQEGLEEALLKDKRLKRISDSRDLPSDAEFTDTEIGAFVQDVQVSGFPEKAGRFVPRARELVQQIAAGEIKTPPFEPPHPRIANQADSRLTTAALRLSDYNDAIDSGDSVATQDIVGDGVTLIGDSVMRHFYGVLDRPETLFGGDVLPYAMTGISLRQVLSGDEVRASDGSKDYQGRRLTPTSEWQNAIATGPSRVVVQLGTNGGGTREEVDQLMSLAGPGREVFWFSQHDGRQSDFNNVLLQASQDYSNLTIVDISDLVDVNANLYHPWEGPGKDPSKKMWQRMLEYVTGTRTPSANLSLACGGDVFTGNINAPTPEAAEAVAWALGKVRARTRYVAGANPGNAAGTAFDCSTFTFTAYSQAGLDWRMKTSSYQWADADVIQLIPMVDPVTGELNAQPGDLVWSNWGAGDGLAAGHVAMIVDTSGESPIIAGAENPESGVKKYSASDYRPSTGWLKKADPNAPVTAQGGNTDYTNDWRQAWVGRVVTGA